MKVQSGANTRNRTLGTVISTNCDKILPLPLKYTWGIYMGAAATAQCDGRDTCKTKQDQNQLWEGGDTGVVLMLGHNARHKHAQTHRYRPTTPSSGIRGGI